VTSDLTIGVVLPDGGEHVVHPCDWPGFWPRPAVPTMCESCEDKLARGEVAVCMCVRNQPVTC
jgi:hypothetical protein